MLLEEHHIERLRGYVTNYISNELEMSVELVDEFSTYESVFIMGKGNIDEERFIFLFEVPNRYIKVEALLVSEYTFNLKVSEEADGESAILKRLCREISLLE